MFVLQAVESGDVRIMEAVQYSPIPLPFATEQVLEKISAARAAAQNPELATQLGDFRRAEGEVRSAIASVRVALARQGLNTGGEPLPAAAAA